MGNLRKEAGIPYRIHHVGLLCGDPAASRRYYQQVLGFKELARFYKDGEDEAFDLTFLYSGSDLLLELIGPPLSDGENAFIAERGHAPHHIALETPDVDRAFEQLMQAGLKAVWEPDSFEFVRHCAILDNNGIIVEILQELDPLPAPAVKDHVSFQFHHASMLVESWQETAAFYKRHFGLFSPFQYIYPHGGAFVYLADKSFDEQNHNVMLELIGKPYQEAREFAFESEFGMGIDHLGVVVADVKTAYTEINQKSSGKTHPPYADYGTEMCWVQDPDENDIELMRPLPTDKIREAFKSGQPYRPAG
ncbi:MAG: VOC family protein [Chloroflexota bacterium]